MSSITLSFLQADPANPTDGASVLAYTRDGAGVAIGSVSDALKVSVANASIVVTATNLDIRDLAFATDKVDVGGSVVALDATTLAALENITVSATNLDIRDLAFATDKVDVTGSAVSITGTVAVTQSTSPWVISATDLDVRDLTHVSDSIKIGDGTDFLAVNADGSLNVTGSFSINGQYAEDSAHVSGNVGLYNLAVRSDAPAVATSADGDYSSQTVDAYNRSWVNSGANVSIASGAASVTTTSALLVAAAAGRRKILVQNRGSKRVAFGPSGVAIGTGPILDPGASVELEIGPALALHAVAESGTQDLRYLQLS